jgi:epidermal growth factor receptor kinase substrate 8
MADSFQFDLDLLTSFDARSKTNGALLSPDEGIRRFRQMVADRSISQIVHVQLRLEPNVVVITDLSMNEEMEHVPINLIGQIVAVTSDRSCGPYNNVLVFTVLEDAFQLAPPEMYFFQCLTAPAERLVNTLTAAVSGKLRFSRKSTAGVVSGPRRTSADISRMQEYERQAQHSARATSTYKPGPAPGEMFRQSQNRDDPSNEKTGQNIKILDHCLDDIERFVARLQQAADAFKKLEKRRLDRREGSSEIGPGDGMLIMRARPPPVHDFIGVFQKFKLAFNLLASLKGLIHNPNSPEMIHFLFTPLGLVVDASRDPKTGLPVLANKVVSPLLSAEAVQLLSDCLTSRENQLWMSLGDAWTQSRDHWQGSVQSFVPIFSNGWSPPPYWLDDGVQLPPGPVSGELLQPVRRSSSVVVDDGLRRKSVPVAPIADSKLPDSEWSKEGRRASAMYPISEITGVVDEKQQKYVWELLAKRAKIFMLIETYTAANPKELTARKGEIVEILDDTRNWWNVRNAAGMTGFLPRTLLKQYVPNEQQPYVPQDNPPSPPPKRSSYTDERTSVSVPPPITGRQYVDPPPPVGQRPSASQPPPIANPRTSVVTDSNRSSVSYTEDRHLGGMAAVGIYQEIPGAPISNYGADFVNAYASEEMWDNDMQAGVPYQRTAVDDLNDEFRKKISVPGLLTKPQTKPKQAVYLHEDSAGDEILYWLQIKGFSIRVQEELCQYDGRRLFSLSKQAIERLFGVDEGGRLYSQLLVQRNRSGFKTARSAELQAILKQRKKIADVVDPSTQSGVKDEHF